MRRWQDLGRGERITVIDALKFRARQLAGKSGEHPLHAEYMFAAADYLTESLPKEGAHEIWPSKSEDD